MNIICYYKNCGRFLAVIKNDTYWEGERFYIHSKVGTKTFNCKKHLG